jgi:hypothetical protein
MEKKSDSNKDKTIFKTVREANLPRGYEIIAKLKDGYVLAIRKDKIQGIEKNERQHDL